LFSLLENSLFATEISEGTNSVANCDGFCKGYSYDVTSDEFCEGVRRRYISVTNSLSYLRGQCFVRELTTVKL